METKASAEVAAAKVSGALGVLDPPQPGAALDVSANIVQEFKARGVAQVIVVLKAPVAAGTNLVAAAVRPDLARFFVSSPLSRDSAIAGAMSTLPRRRTAAAAALAKPTTPAAPAFRVYENLGIILGTVRPDGLDGLRHDSRVASVTGAPELTLIRPRKIAAAQAAAGPTWGVSSLEVQRVWALGLTGKNVVIAHLDTGVDGTHPALRGAITAFAQFDDLGNQVTPTPAPFDSEEHGTHTAATSVGRTANGITMGVAPGAQVASAIVIEGGNVIARVLGGLNWALAQGARILSMSLGLPGWHDDWVPVIQVLRTRGILPVIAVGNEGPGSSRSPGNYSEALSVGAMNQNGAVAPFSSSQTFNRQLNPVVPDLVCPGVDVVSAVPGGGFKSMSGSSMATPHVAGLAALLFQAKTGARVDEVEDAIFKSCVLNAGMPPDRAGLGVPNAVRALEALTGTPVPPPLATSRYAKSPKKRGKAKLTAPRKFPAKKKGTRSLGKSSQRVSVKKHAR